MPVKGCEEYNEVAALLKNVTDKISKAGQSTSEIDSTIKVLKARLADVAKYCLENELHVDPAYFSDTISYIRKAIVALTLEVNDFTSHLKPVIDCGFNCTGNFVLDDTNCQCKCNMQCDSNNEIWNWGKCKCSQFQQAGIVYDLQYQITDLISRISTNVVSSEITKTYLLKLWHFYDQVGSDVNNLEQNFDNINLTEELRLIEERQTYLTTILTEYNDYVTSTTTCGKGCNQNFIQVKDCSCHTSSDVETYYSQLNRFVPIQNTILSYTGPGNNVEYQAFVSRTDEIRTLFQQLYEYYFNNKGSYDQSFIDALLKTITDKITSLINDWYDWYNINNPSWDCKLSCNNRTEVSDYKACLCRPIIGWDVMQDIPLNISTVSNEINSLIIDTKNKNTLLGNL